VLPVQPTRVARDREYYIWNRFAYYDALLPKLPTQAAPRVLGWLRHACMRSTCPKFDQYVPGGIYRNI
jgi:hypothetical protein